MTVVLAAMLGACARPAETEDSGGTEADTTQSESVVVEEQRPVMTDESLIELFEQIDAGTVEAKDFSQYLNTQIPLPAFGSWLREKQQDNVAYHSRGMSIRRDTDVLGWFYVAAFPDRIAFFYSQQEGEDYLLSDWLIVEKQNTLVTIEDLFSVSNTSSFTGKRVEYTFGLEHWDFNTDPLVYDQWFHPDAIIRIDPDAGTLELIEEVPEDQFIMIEGV